MTQDLWLATHPYLAPLASLHMAVEAAAAELSDGCAPVPNWSEYSGEFQAGIPLLLSASVTLDLRPIEKLVERIVERLASAGLPCRLAEESKALYAELGSDGDSGRPIASWLLYGDAFQSSAPGLLHYIGWKALASYLRPVVEAFASWRKDENWLRRYCPTCGSPPAMAQLAGIDPVRQRFLRCGCCDTHWLYPRTACAFCENTDDRQLSVLTVEGEGGLRIDHCQVCGGYLKTYAGSGGEEVFLADWTSFHLDIIALDHGLKRLATSLYAV